MTTFARALVTTSLLMVALACANSTTPEPVGGETHFLHSCDGEAACGLGLECVCGVCTKPCTTDNTCKDQSTSATCEPAGTPSGACDNPQASPVCDVKCTSDSECTTLGATYTCESGSCRKLTVNACLYRGVYYSMEAAMSDPCKWCACKATDEACRGTEHCFPDPWKDSGLDASIDGGIDSGMDAGGDAGIDSGFSSGVDSGADAAMDATVDGAIDATFPPPYVCGGGDADAGTATTPLTPRTHACDRLIDVVANPGVEIVARDLDIEGIAAHEGIVYFTSEFGRRGASTDGARYFALPSYPGQPPELARDVVFAGCELYWTDQYGPTPLIVTADDPDGENPRLLVEFWQEGVDDRLGSFLVDDTHAYLSTQHTIRRVARAGSPLVAFVAAENARSLAERSDWVYWIETNAIVGARKDRSVGRTVLSSQTDPRSIATDETHVYVGTFGDASGPNANHGLVGRIPLGGGTFEPLLNRNANVLQVLVDQTAIYWFERDQAFVGSLWRAPKAAPFVATQLLAPSGEPIRVTQDETHLYWTSQCVGGESEDESTAILRFPKH